MRSILKSLIIAAAVIFLTTGLVQGATVLFPTGGGTGTSTIPCSGCIPVGVGGIYVPRATSTLGLPASPSASIQYNNSGVFGGSSNATLDSNGKAYFAKEILGGSIIRAEGEGGTLTGNGAGTEMGYAPALGIGYIQGIDRSLGGYTPVWFIGSDFTIGTYPTPYANFTSSIINFYAGNASIDSTGHLNALGGFYAGTLPGFPQINPPSSQVFANDATNALVIASNQNAGSGGIVFKPGAGANAIGEIQGTNSELNAVADILLQPEGGNVGIGTDSPIDRLDVNGNAYFGNRTSGNYVRAGEFYSSGVIETYYAGNRTGYFYADTNSAGIFNGQSPSTNYGIQIYNDGSLGIGNSNSVITTHPFYVDTSGNSNFVGNITKINNVTTSFPSSQGAANTYLKNDGSGNFSWSQVSLTTGISGILPIANGGTNNSSAYTAGSVIYSDGSKLTQNNGNLFWDNTNVRLGVGTSTPNATLWLNGSKGSNIVSTAVSLTVATTSTNYIRVTSTASPRTITLPLCNAITLGNEYTVKDSSGGAATNNITVAKAGSDTIDGATSFTINTNYASYMFKCGAIAAWDVN